MPADPRTPGRPYRDIERRLKALESLYVNPVTAASAYNMSPRGRVKYATYDFNSTAYTSSATTDMTITSVTLHSGRLYMAHFAVNYEFASVATTASWQINLRQDLVTLARLATLAFGSVGTFRAPIDRWIPLTVSSDGSYDFDVFANEAVNGANLMFSGSSELLRYLEIYDYGLPG